MGRNAQNRNTHQIRNHICGERTEFSSTSHSPLPTPHQYQSAKTSLCHPIWNTNDERMSHLELPHHIEHQIGRKGSLPTFRPSRGRELTLYIVDLMQQIIGF